MKRWFLIVLCCILAASAYADLHLLVGPSVLVDTQDEISGTALGLNVTLWGLVPNRPNLGVMGAFDTMMFLHSNSDVYDFEGGENIFGFNIAFGFGHAFLLSREIHLKTFFVQAGELPQDLFTYIVSGTYEYSENFDLIGAVDSFGVLPWEKGEGSSDEGEILYQYLPLKKERRLHAGLEMNLNISPIYDVADQSRAGWININPSDFAQNTWYSSIAIYQTGRTELWKDGVLNDFINSNSVSIGGFRIGYRSNDNVYYKGDIAEIIFYDRALDNTERQTVEVYLEDKYGL
jgi:hypothetical protein